MAKATGAASATPTPIPTPPAHKVMYVRTEIPVHEAIAELARQLNLKLTTVANAILAQALGRPSHHSRSVVRAIAVNRKGAR